MNVAAPQHRRETFGSPRLRRYASAAVLAALTMCLVAGMTINATSTRGAADDRLRKALSVTSELEGLLTLHMAANTDFLKGVGAAGYNSRAWPISRAAAVAGAYDRLADDFAGVPQAIASVRYLRQLSAAWPQELDAAARNVALADDGRPIDTHLLQKSNETLSSIMSVLTTLRSHERDEIAQMQISAQSQLLRQKISLAGATASGVLLLILTLFMSHRAALAKSASRIIAYEAERRFNEYFEHHPVAMLIFDVDSYAILTANSAAQRQYGATLRELQSMAIDKLRPAEDVEPFRRDLSGYVASGVRGGSGGLRRHQRTDGTIIHVDIAFHLLDYAGHNACFISARDVTAHEQAKDQLRTLAQEDPLTRLPNRLRLTARFAQMIERASRDDERIALVFFDLDNFKEINDSLGHTAGDAVLCEVARRLATYASDHELIARYAGDEFVAVLYGRGTIERFAEAAKAMQAHLNEDFLVDNKVIRPQACIGIAMFPDDSHDPETLLKYADSAMYRAKSIGPNSLQVFHQTMARESNERAMLARDLRFALAAGEFALAYQPRLSLATGAVNGFEALLRWGHPERGAISPAMFIPVAEENGLIVQIGAWVLEEACRQTTAWARQQPGIVVSVNVSPVQFERSDLPAVVKSILERTGANPRNIELEITEGVLMAPRSLTTLRELREIGLSIAIDDFGSGYSSLGYVRSFMADRVKLDMSFVQGIGQSRADEVIAKAVFAMGRTLGMHVVAEGVETLAQLEFLIENGCDEIQGYWFARPADPETARVHLGRDYAVTLPAAPAVPSIGEH